MVLNIVVFVGPAGAGKSSLVAAYGRWLESVGLRTFKVDLDPAADYVPYSPDYDIRRLVNARDIALKYGLGPNGALVKSIEMVTEKLGDVIVEFRNVEADFVLIDTPGQMEIFIFRDIAPRLVELLKSISDRIAAVFVVDATLIRNPEDYAFLAVMSIALQLRLGVDVVPVLNKIDLVSDTAFTGDVVSDVDKVRESLKYRGLYGEMMAQVLDIIWLYGKAARVPRVSARHSEGLDELHRLIHEITCSCGDLT
ncbi:MAG: GTPase [Thermoprotei archaeon]|nr:MAG: GTPase [Thermoprotei archaeon]